MQNLCVPLNGWYSPDDAGDDVEPVPSPIAPANIKNESRDRVTVVQKRNSNARKRANNATQLLNLVQNQCPLEQFADSC
jgi:hypothetical protein